MKRILVINPGSTSTKIAVYEDLNCVAEESLKMDENFVRENSLPTQQLDVRTEQVREFMKKNNYTVDDFDIIMGRGGMVPYCPGGAYAVNQMMVDVLTYAPYGTHASNLGALVGYRLAEGKKPVAITDPIVVDEMYDIAKVTGIPGVTFNPITHVLNSRYVARETAEEMGYDFFNTSYVVCHMGGGVSTNAYKNGKLVDLLCTETGAMSPQRCGYVPPRAIINMCFSGEYTKADMMKLVSPEGGLYAYLGTQDAYEIELRVNGGDEKAEFLMRAMAYQLSKAIGQMFVATGCEAKAIVLTGAMARWKQLVQIITENVEKLAPVKVIPGEREMIAMAKTGLRILEGTEVAKEYDILPKGYATKADFDAFVAEEKAK